MKSNYKLQVLRLKHPRHVRAKTWWMAQLVAIKINKFLVSVKFPIRIVVKWSKFALYEMQTLSRSAISVALWFCFHLVLCIFSPLFFCTLFLRDNKHTLFTFDIVWQLRVRMHTGIVWNRAFAAKCIDCHWNKMVMLKVLRQRKNTHFQFFLNWTKQEITDQNHMQFSNFPMLRKAKNMQFWSSIAKRAFISQSIAMNTKKKNSDDWKKDDPFASHFAARLLCIETLQRMLTIKSGKCKRWMDYVVQRK